MIYDDCNGLEKPSSSGPEIERILGVFSERKWGTTKVKSVAA
jgi:hypothetical protein